MSGARRSTSSRTLSSSRDRTLARSRPGKGHFRRLSSLAAPVSTVLVAAVTAAVTVLATAWADQLTTPQAPPRPAPSAAATAQP